MNLTERFGDGQIAGQCNVCSRSCRDSIDRAYDRLFHVPYASNAFVVCFFDNGRKIGCIGCRDFFEVLTGAECSAISGDDHTPNRRVLCCLIQCRLKCLAHRLVKAVEHFWAVERNRANCRASCETKID